jgi:hypothetical protein
VTRRRTAFSLAGGPLLLLLSLVGCNCDPKLVNNGDRCGVGTVSGRVCATDQQTWVAGATVSIDGTDCLNSPFSLTVDTGPDGSFTFNDVPQGSYTAHAVLGQFRQDYPIDVTGGQDTKIPDDQMCVKQGATKIAVVTGLGDKIENLLTGLKLNFDTYKGDAANWATDAEPFLADLNRLKAYDIVFVDCAAAKVASNRIDLGPQASVISGNLAAYVQGGGSLYASDWALIFPALAFPGKLTFALDSGTLTNPLDTSKLMGFAPQTVTGAVVDLNLAQFLGKGSVSVTFPASPPSLHWGLMSQVANDVEVLIRADVQPCSTSTCSSGGATEVGMPLAAHFKVTQGAKGGNVVYTSFHNISQLNQDVAGILKYIVLHL